MNEEALNEKIHYIAQNASIKDKTCKTLIKDQIDELETLVQQYGLGDLQITELMEVIIKGKLDDSDVRKLVKLLIPRKNVSEMSVIKIFGNLGNRNIKYSIKVLLLRWVVLIYNFIKDHTKIYRLYGVIFHYLEYASLRPILCHLLYLITRREHVKSYRIRKLIEIQTKAGYEPHIQELLILYKDYFPNLVTINIPLSRSTAFKCPDVTWYQLINQVQSRWSSNRSLLHMPLERPIKEKRRKIEHIDIPIAYTFNVTHKSITLDEISDVKQLASNIDKIQLPNQLASILDHRMLQHVIVSNPERVAITRISYWIDQCLMDLVYWSDQNSTTKMRLDHLLNKLVTMTEFMKELLPVVQEFLMKYIHSWNGKEYQELIFRLLAFLKPEPYNQFYEKVLKPLQYLYNNSSPNWKSQLIHCYTDLLKYWILLHKNTEGNFDDEELDNPICELSINGGYSQTIRNFTDYLNRTILTIPEDENQIELQYAILYFKEIFAFLQSSELDANLSPA